MLSLDSFSRFSFFLFGLNIELESNLIPTKLRKKIVFHSFFYNFVERLWKIEKKTIFAVQFFDNRVKNIYHEKNVSTISKKKKKQARFQKPHGH